MSVDKKLIVRKINLISRDLEELKFLAGLSWKKYQSKFENEIIAERLLERIIGRIIDINFHLVSEIKEVTPKDYFESFALLGDLKILSYDFAKKLSQLAGLRNRLAHEYNGIDEEIIYKSLKIFSKDIVVYLKKIRNFISKFANP